MSEVLKTIQQEKKFDYAGANKRQQKITNELVDAYKELENQLVVEKEDNNMKKERIE